MQLKQTTAPSKIRMPVHGWGGFALEDETSECVGMKGHDAGHEFWN